MLKIWGRKNSLNVQKVLWACAEMEVAFEREDAGMQFGVTDTPAYVAMNPNRLVPTIDDDGFVLWESNSIVRYLAMKHGMGTLCPHDLQTRASAERWMDWQLTTMDPAFRALYLGLMRTAPERRDPDAIERSRVLSTAKFEILDAYLAKTRFLAGDAFSFGDIPLGIHAYRWYNLPGIERRKLSNVERWYAELCARPAYEEHVMIGLS